MTKPKKFTDCAKIYNDCKEAEKYNNIEDDDDDDEQQDEENAIETENKKVLLSTQNVTENENTKQKSENKTQRISTKLFKLQ